MEKEKQKRLRTRKNKSYHTLKIKKDYKTNAAFASLPNRILAIIGQDLIEGKTIFIIKHLYEGEEYRKSAFELYQETSILKKFDFKDLLLILSTAVQEQTIEDMQD